MVLKRIQIYGAHRAIQKVFRFACLCAALIAGASLALADNNSFDLLGPRIEMKVTRKGKPLPISDVA